MNTYKEYMEGRKKMRKLIKEFMNETDKEKTQDILNKIKETSSQQVILKEEMIKNRKRFFKRDKS